MNMGRKRLLWPQKDEGCTRPYPQVITYILMKQAHDRGLDILFHAMQVPGAALLEIYGKGSNFRPVNP